MNDMISDAGTIANVGNAVQLAIAPIFLLVAAGALLNVMTQRLGRVVDRARSLEAMIDADAGRHTAYLGELRILEGRMVAANRAIAACVFASVLVCVMVGVFFCGALFGLRLQTPIAVLFLIIMTAMITGLCFFLYEITLSARSLHVKADYLRGAPDPSNR